MAGCEFDQLFAREHASGALSHRREQRELVARQRFVLAVEPDHARAAVDLEPAEAQHVGRRPGRAAAEHDPDARQELTRLEGLGDVILGADLKPDHLVHRIALRRQHDHRRLGGRCRQGSDPPEDIEAVAVGQHQVEEHEVGRLAPERREA